MLLLTAVTTYVTPVDTTVTVSSGRTVSVKVPPLYVSKPVVLILQVASAAGVTSTVSGVGMLKKLMRQLFSSGADRRLQSATTASIIALSSVSGQNAYTSVVTDARFSAFV